MYVKFLICKVTSNYSCQTNVVEKVQYFSLKCSEVVI